MQEPLWYDSLSEALSAVVEAPELGGPKTVAATLWPTLSVGDAVRRLRHCLDGDRAEKFALDEVDALLGMARRAGVHRAMEYLGTTHGYRVTPEEPESQRAELEREFVAAVGVLREIEKRMAATERRGRR